MIGIDSLLEKRLFPFLPKTEFANNPLSWPAAGKDKMVGILIDVKHIHQKSHHKISIWCNPNKRVIDGKG